MKFLLQFFQDFNGDASSKRLIAAFCFLAAAIIAIVGLITKQELAIDLVNSFLFSAVSLLVGGTAAEQIQFFSKKKETKENKEELL